MPPKPKTNDTQIDNNEILPKLRLTIRSWENRRYLNTEMGTQPREQDYRTFTDINETRRKEKLEFLGALMNWWKTHHYFTPKQRAIIQKAAKSAGVLEKEVKALAENDKILEFPITVPKGAPPAGTGGVAPGETGHSTPEERTKRGLWILDQIMKQPCWPENINDRDYEFLNSIFIRSEEGRLREISVRQYEWLYNCYERYVIK